MEGTCQWQQNFHPLVTALGVISVAALLTSPAFWLNGLSGVWSKKFEAFAQLLLIWLLQDEQFDHLDEADIAKVEKSANEAMEWMNNKLNLQNKRSLTLDPVIKAKDIQAKTKVSLSWKYSELHNFSCSEVRNL